MNPPSNPPFLISVRFFTVSPCLARISKKLNGNYRLLKFRRRCGVRPAILSRLGRCFTRVSNSRKTITNNRRSQAAPKTPKRQLLESLHVLIPPTSLSQPITSHRPHHPPSTPLPSTLFPTTVLSRPLPKADQIHHPRGPETAVAYQLETAKYLGVGSSTPSSSCRRSWSQTEDYHLFYSFISCISSRDQVDDIVAVAILDIELTT